MNVEAFPELFQMERLEKLIKYQYRYCKKKNWNFNEKAFTIIILSRIDKNIKTLFFTKAQIVNW